MKALVSVALVLALAGCTAQQTAPTATKKPVSSAPHVISGSGPSHNTLTVPAGAKSAQISTTCDGGDEVFLSVTIGNEDQPHAGRCSSPMTFRVPAGGTLALATDLSGTGRYQVTVRFSATPFTSDPKLTTQCADVSGAFSDFASAMNGYPNGPLDQAGWRALMASGATKLAAVDTSGALGAQLPPLIAWYSRADLTPGGGIGDTANDAYEAVNTLCLDNGSPLAIVSQYGG